MSNYSIIKEAELIYKEKNMLHSFLFYLFLGFFGCHRFYLDQFKEGIFIFILFFVSLFTLDILWFFFGIYLMLEGFHLHNRVIKYNKEKLENRKIFIKKSLADKKGLKSIQK